MPYITPKTDWTPVDGVANADLNRMEGNTAQIKADTDGHATTNLAHNATSSPLGSRIVARDSNGSTEFEPPTTPKGAARKTDVDTAMTAAANAQSKADAALPASSYNATDVANKIKSLSVAAAAINVDMIDGKHAAAALLTNEKSDLAGAINELFTSASNGKNLIAGAINRKGGSASGADTFQVLTNKIDGIQLATGNASAADVLSGRTFSTPVAGTGATGTMPDYNGAVVTPSGNGRVAIPYGRHNGSVVEQVSVNSSTLLTGWTVAGVAGTMPSHGSPAWNPTTVNQYLPAGYFNGGVVYGSGNLAAGNIRNGVDIFGVIGNLQARQVLRGTTGIIPIDSSANWSSGVINLPFKPRMAVGFLSSNNTGFQLQWTISMMDMDGWNNAVWVSMYNGVYSYGSTYVTLGESYISFNFRALSNGNIGLQCKTDWIAIA